MKLKKKVKRLIVVVILLILIIIGLFIIKDNILKKDKVQEVKIVNKIDKYVSKLSEMFIYDFYSLNDKTAKTDIGGVDFVYSEALANFLLKAEDTYYKYVESNIYGNRNQSLPTVKDIEITSVSQQVYAYGDKTDEKAYIVQATWDYTDDQFSKYQSSAKLVFIHDGDKLSLVELQ